jgi:hypothetical protein
VTSKHLGLVVVAQLIVGAVAAPAMAQSKLVRLGDVGGDLVGPVAIAGLGDERCATVATDGAGELQIATWNATADGKLDKRSAASAGKTTVFAAVGLGATQLVTAVKKEDGGLRLIAWAVAADGSLARKGQIDAGPIDRVAIAAAGPARVVTATAAAGATKLIVWDVSAAGQLTRRGDHDTAAGTRAAVTALSASRLVVAVQGADGTLEVSAWSLDAAGAVAPLGSTKSGKVSEIAITSAALDRAVTAVRRADGNLEVAAWDVDATGAVKLAGSASAGAADHVALAALSSAKVVTALRQGDHTLKLVTWQVVDTVTRLDSIAAGPASEVAVAALGWDRALTVVRDSDKKLKLIDYADVSVGLLHASWGPSPASAAAAPSALAVTTAGQPVDDEELISTRGAVAARPPRAIANETAEGLPQAGPHPPGPPPPPGPPGPPPPPAQSPAPALVFKPDIGGVDPMIAVGKNFVVITEDHAIEFLYKTGAKAGQRVDSKAGEKTRLSATEFFGGFFAAKNADGTTNRNLVNLHLMFPPSFDAVVTCTPPSTAAPCMNEAYDTRVTYDPYRGRFIIMSAIRGVGLSGATTSVARRYVAIAVSRTEDPRDGFLQYMTTESNYSDWPRIASGDGVLVVTHNACKGPDDQDTCGSDHQIYPRNTMALRPMAYVYRIDDMIAGNPQPKNWKLYPYQADGGGTFYPVAHQGSTSGWTYLVKPKGDALDVFAFKQPAASWGAPPALSHTSFSLDGGMSGYREPITFRAGKLHFASAISVAARVPNVSPERWHVRAVRIPISHSGGFKAGPCPATSGCLDVDFGLHALEDAPGDVLSYEMPSLVPDASGNLILVYGRVPVTMAHPIGQEARFSIIYSDARGLVRSRLIQAGGVVLKDKYCSGTSETTAVAENYWHVWYGGGSCASQKDYQDYGTAAVDPDGKSFWVVHAYADASGGFKMVGAKVVP